MFNLKIKLKMKALKITLFVALLFTAFSYDAEYSLDEFQVFSEHTKTEQTVELNSAESTKEVTNFSAEETIKTFNKEKPRTNEVSLFNFLENKIKEVDNKINI